MQFKLRRAARDEDNTETRPTLRLIRGTDGLASVQLHMPHLTYWSEAMPIEGALSLIERDGGLTSSWDGQTVDVVDGGESWPIAWPALSPTN